MCTILSDSIKDGNANIIRYYLQKKICFVVDTLYSDCVPIDNACRSIAHEMEVDLETSLHLPSSSAASSSFATRNLAEAKLCTFLL